MTDKPPLPVITEVTNLRPTLARMSLWTGDRERLEAFYTGMFGFERAAFTVIEGDERGLATLKAWRLDADTKLEVLLMRSPRGDTELGISSVVGQRLADVPSAREGPPLAGSSYIVIYVPDLDAIIRACEEQDVGFNRAPKRIPGPDGRIYYEMAIYDPDGRVLLVVQDVAPA